MTARDPGKISRAGAFASAAIACAVVGALGCGTGELMSKLEEVRRELKQTEARVAAARVAELEITERLREYAR